MTLDQVSIGIAAASFVVALVAMVKSSSASAQANKLAEEHLKLVHAQVEIEMRNQIIDSQHHVENFYRDHQDFLAKDKATLSAEEKGKRERLVITANSAIEGYLNALDTACQKSLDGKIDRTRFKKSYQREIRQAVQADAHRDFFKTGHAFNALMRVYDDWENPEKSK